MRQIVFVKTDIVVEHYMVNICNLTIQVNLTPLNPLNKQYYECKVWRPKTDIIKKKEIYKWSNK